MPRSQRILLKAAIMILSSAVCLVMVEAGLRLKNRSMANYDVEMWRYARELKRPSANPVLGHEHRNSRSAILQSVTIRLNELGLRGGPVRPRREAARRILFLGSSITLGWGVPEEDTLVARVDRLFRRDGEDVEVFNAGVGNYNAVRCVELFLTRLGGSEPTDIVLQYFINAAEVLDPGGGNVLLRHSQLAVTLWIVTTRIFGETGERSLEEHYRRMYAPASRGFQEMEQALKRLGDYTRKHRIRLYLAMTPDLHDLGDYKFAYIHELMASLAAKHGYTYVDFLPAFRGLKTADVWAMAGDPHPNSLGHRKMAEALYPVLAAKRPARRGTPPASARVS